MLFGKKKKVSTCSCGGNCDSNKVENENARIKILGSGCAKCNELENSVKIALNDLNINDEVSHVKDFAKIAGYGVMSTPALVIDETVVSMGKVLSVDEVKKILENKK